MSADEAQKDKRPDFMDIIAKRKLGLDEQWKIASWRRVDPDALLVSIGKFRKIERGEKKGHDTWVDVKGKPLSERKEMVMTVLEIKEEESRWERETGKCSQCGGSGEAWVGYSISTGNRYDTCRRCSGNGNAKTA